MGLVKPRHVKAKVSKQQRLEVPPTTGRTSKNQTDVILPTTDDCMQKILKGEKNFEFRKYLLPKTVKRVWFYVKAPFSCIAYICEIEPGVSRLEPGFTSLPLTGLWNDCFNNHDPCLKGFDYAYYIRSAYVVKEPLHLDEMKALYGVSCAPRGMVYVPEKMKEEVWAGDGSRLVVGGVGKVLDRGKRQDEGQVTHVRPPVKKVVKVVRTGSLMDVDMDGGDTDVEEDEEEAAPLPQQQPAQRTRLSHKRGRSSMSMDLSMSSINGLKSRAKRQKT